MSELGAEVYTCDPRTWGAEAGGLEVSGQLGLQNETISKKHRGNVVNKISPSNVTGGKLCLL